MNRLEGKIALVTGVSRGIGPYIVRALSCKGALVIGIARNEEKLIKLQKQLQLTIMVQLNKLNLNQNNTIGIIQNKKQRLHLQQQKNNK